MSRRGRDLTLAFGLAALVAGIGYLLVLTAGPRLLLYWAIVIAFVLLKHGLWVMMIAAVVVFFVHVARSGRHQRRLSAPRTATAAQQEETT